MKCPKCQLNHRVKFGLNCNCGYGFTFNPKENESHGLTDGKFAYAIRKASQNETASFTRNQLYAAYANAIAGKTDYGRWAGILFVPTLVIFAFFFEFPPIVLLILGAIVFACFFFSKTKPMSHMKFMRCIDRWQKAGKPIVGLIEKPELHEPPPQWDEQDIYDYGVERILVVQHDLLVDLFVKNNQHAEQRMLVIAESGYPQYLIPQVERLIRERPDLPVFLLHDADDCGTEMIRRVRNLPWLATQNETLIDLGFFDSDFQKLSRAKAVRNGYRGSPLPADALGLNSMMIGLAACFALNTTFATEIAREASNEMSAGSSFG